MYNHNLLVPEFSMKKLEGLGLLQSLGTFDDGEPRYGSTELGRRLFLSCPRPQAFFAAVIDLLRAQKE